jgi:hypothetical protein
MTRAVMADQPARGGRCKRKSPNRLNTRPKKRSMLVRLPNSSAVQWVGGHRFQRSMDPGDQLEAPVAGIQADDARAQPIEADGDGQQGQARPATEQGVRPIAPQQRMDVVARGMTQRRIRVAPPPGQDRGCCSSPRQDRPGEWAIWQRCPYCLELYMYNCALLTLVRRERIVLLSRCPCGDDCAPSPLPTSPSPQKARRPARRDAGAASSGRRSREGGRVARAWPIQRRPSW